MLFSTPGHLFISKNKTGHFVCTVYYFCFVKKYTASSVAHCAMWCYLRAGAWRGGGGPLALGRGRHRHVPKQFMGGGVAARGPAS